MDFTLSAKYCRRAWFIDSLHLMQPYFFNILQRVPEVNLISIKLATISPHWTKKICILLRAVRSQVFGQTQTVVWSNSRFWPHLAIPYYCGSSSQNSKTKNNRQARLRAKGYGKNFHIWKCLMIHSHSMKNAWKEYLKLIIAKVFSLCDSSVLSKAIDASINTAGTLSRISEYSDVCIYWFRVCGISHDGITSSIRTRDYFRSCEYDESILRPYLWTLNYQPTTPYPATLR